MNSSTLKRKQVHTFKEPARHDPYRSESKPQGTPRCPDCKAVSIRGRWIPLVHAKAMRPSVLVTGELKCPACRQLQDHFAMGVVELRGESWQLKKNLVMNTIHNTEQIARNRNDQHRVLWIRNLKDVTKIYVSLPELARHIGHQLEKSFHGESEYQRSTEEPYLRVRWCSDPGVAEMKVVPAHRPETKAEKHPAIERPHKSRAFRTRGQKA